MIMLCKHCFDILGYDNKFTNRSINQECDHCKKGLNGTDVIFVDDLMVPLLVKLNKELGIKTYYSCIGHIDRGITRPTYLVLEDTEKVRYLFDALIKLKKSYCIIKKDGSDKLRIDFKENRYKNVYGHTKGKVRIIKFVCEFIDNLVNSDSYPFK